MVNENRNNEIINSNEKTIKTYNYKEIYKIIVDFSSNYVGKAVLTGVFLFAAYLFYQLGYSFLYGYYFGGEEAAPIFTLINQIPFDFKYIVIIGIGISGILSLFFIVAYMIVSDNNNLCTKIFYAIINCFMYLLITELINIIVGGLNLSNYTKLLYQLFSMLYIFLGFIKCNIIFIKKLLLGTFFSFCYLFSLIALVIFSSMISIEFNSYYGAIFLFILYIAGIALIYIFSNIKIFIASSLVVIIVSYIIYDKYNNFNSLTISAIFFVVLSLMGIQKVSNIIESRKNVKKYEKKFKKIKKNKIMIKNKTIKIMLFPTFILCFTMLYFLLYVAFYDFGNYFGMTSKLKCYKINYMNSESKSINGLVVKQVGTTYYISEEGRKLVIITSNQLLVTH
ncbi:hypothetical protein C8E03_108153 [Lachnotalea glycerini]|uniref:Uncharacterized protein n=1 Tax=Lachnotalea glycerini TaxID=1763509 RepID=A0A318ELM0_9FIRM|nr:hypothetical protein [Lachnotalea glycerini]PXV88426.1 hypothetical protein C8E03_108153 [Lachnotalea glycerini]